MTTLTVTRLTPDQLEALYLPRARDLSPGDVIYGLATDYTSPSKNKIGVVVKLTAVSHRGDRVRLFGIRLTSKEKGREWSTSWINDSERFEIPF